MIVCLCRALPEHAIRAAIADGAFSVEDVGAVCRAGTACGACRPTLERMIEEAGAGAA
jgi:assimilatory nitrate reductase catalytic subunit